MCFSKGLIGDFAKIPMIEFLAIVNFQELVLFIVIRCGY
jgi:hypothetical protein